RTGDGRHARITIGLIQETTVRTGLTATAGQPCHGRSRLHPACPPGKSGRPCPLRPSAYALRSGTTRCPATFSRDLWTELGTRALEIKRPRCLRFVRLEALIERTTIAQREGSRP